MGQISKISPTLILKKSKSMSQNININCDVQNDINDFTKISNLINKNGVYTCIQFSICKRNFLFFKYYEVKFVDDQYIKRGFYKSKKKVIRHVSLFRLLIILRFFLDNYQLYFTDNIGRLINKYDSSYRWINSNDQFKHPTKIFVPKSYINLLNSNNSTKN